jgi:outer membrane lipoprotein
MNGNDHYRNFASNRIKNRRNNVFGRAYILLAVFFTLLTSCATQPPVPLRVNLTSNPTVAQVLKAPDHNVGTKVRWGGVIHKITNLKTETELEIISRDLDKKARPRVQDNTYGRFLARIPGFLEPSVFAPNREITVVGTVTGTLKRPIGEFEYTYPVVDVKTYHLWDARPVQEGYDNWWMYDPWYWGYPWYPWWYPYPY